MEVQNDKIYTKKKGIPEYLSFRTKICNAIFFISNPYFVYIFNHIKKEIRLENSTKLFNFGVQNK